MAISSKLCSPPLLLTAPLLMSAIRAYEKLTNSRSSLVLNVDFYVQRGKTEMKRCCGNNEVVVKGIEGNRVIQKQEKWKVGIH